MSVIAQFSGTTDLDERGFREVDVQPLGYLPQSLRNNQSSGPVGILSLHLALRRRQPIPSPVTCFSTQFSPQTDRLRLSRKSWDEFVEEKTLRTGPGEGYGVRRKGSKLIYREESTTLENQLTFITYEVRERCLDTRKIPGLGMGGVESDGGTTVASCPPRLVPGPPTTDLTTSLTDPRVCSVCRLWGP